MHPQFVLKDSDLSGFDAGHRSVVRNNQISPNARLLFVIINSFASTKQGCYIGNARLAFYFGCTRRTIQRLLKELIDANIIQEEVKHGFRRLKIISSVDIRNEEAYDMDVIPPATYMSQGDDTSVTQGIDKGIDKTNTKVDEDFEKFYNTYDEKARYGNRKDDIRRQWNKTMAEGNDPQVILSALERKKKRIEEHRRNPRSEFEPNFPYPVKFLRNELWKAVKMEPKTKNVSIFSVDKELRNIPPTVLTDFKRLKASKEALSELNSNWEYWQSRKINGEGMTDLKIIKEAQEAAERRKSATLN